MNLSLVYYYMNTFTFKNIVLIKEIFKLLIPLLIKYFIKCDRNKKNEVNNCWVHYLKNTPAFLVSFEILNELFM